MRRCLPHLHAAPSPAADPGHGPRAQHGLRRRRRARGAAALQGQPRALWPQARAVRLAAREPLRGQHRHVLFAAPARQHQAVLQRGHDRRRPRATSCGARRTTARRRSSSSRPRLSPSRSTRACRHRSSPDSAGRRAAARRRAHRRRALPAGRARRAATWLSTATSSWRRSSSAAARSCATARRSWADGRVWPARVHRGDGERPRRRAAFGPGGAARELRRLLHETAATTVVDLSDEPVLGYRERFLLISAALAGGARYVGADFEFTPQALAPTLDQTRAGDHRHRQAGRQDGGERLRRPPPARALCGRRGVVVAGHGPRRAAAARGRARGGARGGRSAGRVARAVVTRRPTATRTRCSPA